MKKALLIFGGIVILAGVLIAFDLYRDMQNAEKVMADFKPNLGPIKDLSALSQEETEAYKACLAEKMALQAGSKDEQSFCRCFAVGTVEYVMPLVKKNETSGAKAAANFLKAAGEIAGKSSVIMKICAEKTSG